MVEVDDSACDSTHRACKRLAVGCMGQLFTFYTILLSCECERGESCRKQLRNAC